MKVLLMDPRQDGRPDTAPPDGTEDLCRDLGLDTVIEAMASGDGYLADVARRTMLSSLDDVAVIRYRQEVLADVLRRPGAVQDLYALAVRAIRSEERNALGLMSHSPGLHLQRSADVLTVFTDTLADMRRIAEAHGAHFRSAGFTRLFRMFTEDFDEVVLATVREHLRDLRFPDGVLVGARLGPAGTGVDHVLRRPRRPAGGPLHRRTGGRDGIDVRIRDGDDTAARAVDDIVDRGVARTAAVLARANAEILSFLVALRHQVAFYLGCLHLHRRLGGRPVCRPGPLPAGRPGLSCRGLYDVCLPLTAPDRPAVGNDLDADSAKLIMVTGANQGGKSTFLRALGLAQLMMQCGMFVPAASLRATVRPGVFTHFPRDEDATMARGRLDEELARLSAIADRLTGGALVLLNESFATTNEREGSQIAREIIRALTERDVTVVCVTHLFDLAHGLYLQGRDDAVFLRADRLPDGRRTFRLRPGPPQPTGYGPDLYRRIFGSTAADR